VNRISVTLCFFTTIQKAIQKAIQKQFTPEKYKSIKVILYQFWVKKFVPWKFNLEYGGTFTKLFMHVSSRNMLPTIRNLQIRKHVSEQNNRKLMSLHNNGEDDKHANGFADF
jgi:lauroyl/myristoyl acyltransferase